MRVKPSPTVTVALAIGYMAIVAVTWLVVGTDYEAVGDSTANVLKGIVLPVGLASVFMAGATSYLGWWRPAIHEELRAPTWLWAVPVLMLVPGVGSVLGGFGPADRSASYLLALGLGTLLVGFGEEMLTRGTGLVGLRGRFGEPLSWFFSCLLFGLIHSLNVLFGQSLASTVQQIVIAFLAGSVLYITRRVSGTLIVCMLLHAWIDFTTLAFSDAATEAESPFAILSFAQWAAFILAIVGVVIVLRRGGLRREPAPQAVAAG
jgi:membrane protease YdiL (CAAX protease family)